MQRILSVETSRNIISTTEVVTKRLCCSVILSVAFFALLGGKWYQITFFYNNFFLRCRIFYGPLRY